MDDAPSDMRTFRAPLATAEDVPRVGLEDLHLGRELLREHGVCIFSNVATPEELAEREHLFWKWAGSATGRAVKRGDPSSMRNATWKKLGFIDSGVIARLGIGQSEFMWSCRQLPNVRRVFQAIWETDDVVTGFDGCGAFRNPFLMDEENWRTKGGWFHVDQNAHHVPGLDTYQGLLNFFPANTEMHGSTVVVPRSHLRFNEMFEDPCRQNIKDIGHVKLDKPGDFERYVTNPVQVGLNPGDFLVWDSRTIHCSQGIHPEATAEALLGSRASHPLARLVAYICMVPRTFVDESTAKLRVAFVNDGMTGPHHPIRIGSQAARLTADPTYSKPKPTDPLWKLV